MSILIALRTGQRVDRKDQKQSDKSKINNKIIKYKIMKIHTHTQRKNATELYFYITYIQLSFPLVSLQPHHWLILALSILYICFVFVSLKFHSSCDGICLKLIWVTFNLSLSELQKCFPAHCPLLAKAVLIFLIQIHIKGAEKISPQSKTCEASLSMSFHSSSWLHEP